MLTDTSRHSSLLNRFDRARRQTAALFDLVTDEAYYKRPISLRNPIVFYEGHISAFAVNTLLKRALGRPGIDDELEVVFARGIDPETETRGTEAAWPSRERVKDYVAEADRRLREALEHEDLDRPGHPLLERAEAAYTAIEHEELHQETLHYIWHRLPDADKRAPAGYRPDVGGSLPSPRKVRIDAGKARLGADRGEIVFGWDNESPALEVPVGAFAIDADDVTNAEYLGFVEDGGYLRESLWTPDSWAWRLEHEIAHPLFWERDGGGWRWRAMFGSVPLPGAWPVYVSHAEAEAFLRWRGDRLPTEAEFHRAAFGTPGGSERAFPWGEQAPEAEHGNFGNRHFDPVAVGSYPAGVSAWGVRDLVGNGWKWTATPFGPYPGFRAMASYPEYSADFFDNRHFVMKGASPATPAATIRRSFRNWFRPHYPYVYATFRGVSSNG